MERLFYRFINVARQKMLNQFQKHIQILTLHEKIMLSLQFIKFDIEIKVFLVNKIFFQ